jgi:hypothetical protein
MTTNTAHANDETTNEAHENDKRTAAAQPSPSPAPVQALATVVGVEEGGHINVFSSSAAFELAQREAKALAAGTMVPAEYRNHIPNCLLALEMASRINASVLAVMQNIDMIHGRPSWRATFLIATVNACGRFTSLRFRWVGKEGTPTFGCRAVATDRETGEELVGTAITWAMVDGEGWSKKAGSKWKTMSEQMFQYRAAAFWARIFAPELSLGMRTSDENEDIGGPVQAQVVRQPTARRGINQFAAPRAEPVDPPVQAEQGQEDAPMPEHDPETGEVEEGNGHPELPDEYA